MNVGITRRVIMLPLSTIVCNPAGEILARAQEGTEEILYADINLNDVKNSHAQKLFLRDRRPELYCDWLGK
jgi:predicted amidohydrolase